MGSKNAIFGPGLLCNDQAVHDGLISSVREDKPGHFLPGERLLFSTLYLHMVSGIKREKCGLKYVIHTSASSVRTLDQNDTA